MATSILDLMGHVQNQFEAGRQERKQKQIGSLAAMAYGAKPQERAGYMQQLVELDPEAATRLQGVLDTGDDRKRQALGRAATLILEAPDEMRASLWPQIVSDLEAQGITGMKPQWSPEALPMAQRIAQAFGGGGAGDELKSLRIGANGNYWAIRGGQFVDTGVPAAPNVQIIDAGAAGHYGVNKRTLGATPVRVGAGVPAQSLLPQAGEPAAMPPDVVTAAANRMAKAGVPPEEIDAWVAQATGGAWSDSQPQAAPASADPILRKVPQISPAEQQRLAFEAERLDLERQRAANEMGPPKPAELAKDEMGIRKELEGRTREYQQVLDAYRRVEAAASSPTAASDLSLIFGYMKMLDPGSVVREGEFANAQNTAGIPDRVRNLYNRALSGERLNPQQRQEFLAEARKLRDIAQAEKGKLEMQYGELAEQYGFDPVRATGSRLATPEARQRQQQAEQMLREARQAISRGADREAVKQRLIQMGFPNTASRL